MKAFYGVAARHEYLRVAVPFCNACAKRHLRWAKTGTWVILVSLGMGVAAAVWLGLGSWGTFALAATACAPGLWMQYYGGRVARIRKYDEDTLTFSFKRPEYAGEFAGLNDLRCK